MGRWQAIAFDPKSTARESTKPHGCPVQHGVDQGGQDNEARQQGRQVLLAVPVVVLEVVALGHQGVVVLVFDLPVAAPGLGDLRYVAVAQRQVGRKGVAVQHLAVRRGGGEFAPVDPLPLS